MERKQIYRKVCDESLVEKVASLQALTEEIVSLMNELPERKLYCSFNRHVDEFYTNTKEANEVLKNYHQAVEHYLSDYTRSRSIHREMRDAVERMRTKNEATTFENESNQD